MIDANPFVVKIRCAELERDAARGVTLKEYRPEGPRSAKLGRGAALAAVIGGIALGALALSGTAV
jgi:hypothetical protein